MGRAIQEVAAEHQRFTVVGRQDVQLAEGSLAASDVAIDFSLPEGTIRLLEDAVGLGKALVIGTTGHDTEQRAAIEQAAQKIAIVKAGNFSVGVNTLFHLTALTAKLLAEDYDREVIEAHHRHKKDAPSGTAVRLVEILREATGATPADERHGRSGNTGARTDQEIGVHALRGGEIVGEHSVLFIGAGDRVELTHRAQDRRIFVDGALRAAEWVAGKTPGLYNMEDVLGFRGAAQ